MIFSVTCVRLSVCLSVCLSVSLSVCLSVRKSLSEDNFRKSWPIWTKFSVNVGIALESGLSLWHYGGSNISPKFGEGVILSLFQTIISRKRLEIFKICRDLVGVEFWDLQFCHLRFLNFSNGFWDISKKVFFKKLWQGLRLFKTPWIWPNYIRNVCYNLESITSPSEHVRGNTFPKIGGKGDFSLF